MHDSEDAAAGTSAGCGEGEGTVPGEGATASHFCRRSMKSVTGNEYMNAMEATSISQLMMVAL
jgi:hypothetical protein